MRHYVLQLILCLFCTVAYAQGNYNVDSLKTELAKENNDTARINILLALVESIYDDKVWPAYNDEAHRMALKLSASKDKKLYDFAQRALADTYTNKGYLFKINGNAKKAIEYYHKGLIICQKMNYLQSEATTTINLSTLLAQQKQYDEALKYMRRSLAIGRKLNDKMILAYTYQSIGSVFGLRDQYDSAHVYLYNSLDLFKQIKNPNGQGELYNSIGTNYYMQGKLPEALDCYYKARQLFVDENNKRQLCNTHFHLGRIFHQMDTANAVPGNLRALKHLDTSLAQAREVDFIEGYADTYKLRSDIYLTLSGQPAFSLLQRFTYLEQAYSDFKNYKTYSDSVFNKEILDNTVKQQAAFEYEKKEAVLKEKQKKEREIARVDQKRRDVILYATIIGLVLLLLFLIFLVNRFRIIRRQKAIIETQKEMVEEKQKEIIDSINYAQRIQSAILAREEDIRHYFPESFLLYKPKDIVAGDFYFFETTPTHVFYAAADCTGHGVPGALVSVVCANALSRCVNEFGLTDPGSILDKTRQLVLETFKKSGQDVKDGMDISLISLKFPARTTACSVGRECSKFNVESSKLENSQIIHGTTGNIKPETSNIELQWAGANNPLWIVRKNGEKPFTEIKPDKQPIGLHEMPVPFTTHNLSLQPGDIIYLFTDGYADQFGGPQGKKFKYSNLAKILQQLVHTPMQEQGKKLDRDFESWRGNLEQVDDVCVIGIRV